jgi:uncharacterized membrane protein YhaH (DUF805 family)
MTVYNFTNSNGRGPRGPFLFAVVVSALLFLATMALVAKLGHEIMQIYFEPSQNVIWLPRR